MCLYDAANCPSPAIDEYANYEEDFWTVVFICPETLRGEIMRLSIGFHDVLVRPLWPVRAVVTVDEFVLPWLAELDREALSLSPDRQLATDKFQSIVDPQSATIAVPFSDAFEAPNDSFVGKRERDFDADPFEVKVIQHVQ